MKIGGGEPWFNSKGPKSRITKADYKTSHQRAVECFQTDTLIAIKRIIENKGRFASWWESQRLPHVNAELKKRKEK